MAMHPSAFAALTPRFLPEEYFAGRTLAWGLFEDRFGKVRRQFEVTIDGQWDSRELTLDERFQFKDGGTDRRVWRIVRVGEGLYQGRADDVIGTAAGIAQGNALNWRYDMRLKVGRRCFHVHFDDWMFLQTDEVLLNVATISKWGFAIGRVTLAFRRLG